MVTTVPGTNLNAKVRAKITKPASIEFVKALFFGAAGSGKTHALGTAMFDDRTAPLLVLDFEGGTTSIVGSGADVYHIHSWEDYNEIYKYLSQVDPITKKPIHGYKTIAVDNLSEMHLYALVQQMEDQPVMEGPSDTAERQMYNKALLQMQQFIRSFRDLPNVHVLYTAWAKTQIEPVVGNMKKPMLFGQLADSVVGMFDGAFLFEQTQKTGADLKIAQAKGLDISERRVYLKNTFGTRAKMRTAMMVGNIPDSIGPLVANTPTVSMIFDLWGIKHPTFPQQ